MYRISYSDIGVPPAPKERKREMALGATYDTERKDGILVQYQVAARTIIFKGAMVCLNADGYAISAEDGRGLKFVGFAYERGENPQGNDGDAFLRVWKDGSFRVEMASALISDLGAEAFVVDDNTVSLATANNILAGTIVEICPDNIVRVLIRNAVV